MSNKEPYIQNDPITVPKANESDKNFLSWNSFFIEFAYYTYDFDYLPAGVGGLSLKYNRTNAVGISMTKN